VALADFTWKPFTFSVLDLGYRHDFAQALIGTFYDLDTVWASINQGFFAGRLALVLRGAWERRGYHGLLAADALAGGDTSMPIGRLDDILVMHAQLDVPIKDWLIISLGDDLSKNFSNCRLLGPTIGPPCSYFRNDVWLRVAVSY